MRRLVCALLLAALVSAYPAWAEAPETTDAGDGTAPRAESFDEALAGFRGAWVPFEDGFKLYLPETWRSFEVTDAQLAAGLFYRAGNVPGADGGVPMAVAVGWMDAGALADAEALAAQLNGAGFAGARADAINGIPAVRFHSDADGFCGAAFFHPTLAGCVMLVYATPIGEAADAILASLSLRTAGETP